MSTITYDLKGQRYGKLLIIKRLEKINHRSLWLSIIISVGVSAGLKLWEKNKK